MLKFFQKTKEIVSFQKDMMKKIKKFSKKYKDVETEEDYEKRKFDILRDFRELISYIYQKIDNFKSLTKEEKEQIKKKFNSELIKLSKEYFPELKNKDAGYIKTYFQLKD